MFLQPKKFKYKKVRKGKLSKLEFKSNKLNFGNVGLKATESGIIHARHIEASRQAISRKIKRKGKIWIRIFPDLPITAKPTESRMGKGKGSLSHWGSRVRGGTVLFELCGVKDYNIAIEALKTGGTKLPVKTKIFY
uniref:Ribosomal protein L16 n=1 Tax=Pleurosigma intermedium TaxID=197753 RepID=A0A8F9R4G2_9STRA|nr:ribosomal protein L16 [Pleurosigma sp. mgcode 4]